MEAMTGPRIPRGSSQPAPNLASDAGRTQTLNPGSSPARPRGLEEAAALDIPLAAAQIRARQEGYTGPSDEARIVQTLAETPKGTLNAVLGALDLDTLLSDVDDHMWPLPQYRTQLLSLLTVDRVQELSVPNRARLITALQTGNTNKPAERAIRDLFLATEGPALTELKNRVDAGGDSYDLQQLLHHDIDSEGIRQTVLAHFAAQAKTQPVAGTKLLSDIDDTLYASLNDKRYDKGTIYPGVHAFHAALAGKPADGQTDLVFLSARPRDRMGILETVWTQRSLEKMGTAANVVLSGSLLGLLNHERMAAKKLENFEEYAALFREYRFVFVGDSGQGDPALAQSLRARHAAEVPLTFIHDLGDPGLDAAQRAEARAEGRVYFDSYVGAALAAAEHGLVSDDGLRAVVEASEAALPGLKPSTAQLIEADIAAARAHLGA